MVSPELKIIIENSSGVEQGELKNAQNISFTRFLSSIGELTLTLPHDDPKFALLTGISSYIKVVRNGTTVWRGVYDYLRETAEVYTIFASTPESLMKYYLTTPDNPTTSTIRKFTGKKLGTEIAQVLFNEAKAKANSLLANYTIGTVENPYVSGTSTEITSDFEFDYHTLYDVIDILKDSGGADFEIGLDKTFNFYRRKGADKPNVVFHFDIGDPSNITSYKRDVDFRELGNDIYVFGVGVGANFLKGNTSDATSITTYGRKEKNLGMPKVLVDQDALDKLVADQIQTQKEPSQIISPSVITKGVGFFDGWSIGDNIKLAIANGQTVVSVYKRVIGVHVAYTQAGAETVYLYLGEKRV